MTTFRPALGSRYTYRRDQWNPALHVSQRNACAAVQEAIDNGTLTLEPTKCLCGNGTGTVVSTRDWFGFHYPLELCAECGVLRAGHRFTSESMDRFYGTWYRSVYQRPFYGGGLEEEWAARVVQAERRFRQITMILDLPEGATVVDIGCNFGHLLERFHAAGMDVWGCDLGLEHLELGRQRLGLRQLVVGDASALAARGVQADLVILDHVFEHFAHPLQELARITTLLRPGGRIFVSVPGTWWWTSNVCSGDFLALLQNAHCFQYDLDTLTETFARLGFGRTYGDEHVNAVFEYEPPPRPSESSPDRAARVLHRLRTLERRRRLRRLIAQFVHLLGLTRIAARWRERPEQR